MMPFYCVNVCSVGW